MYRHWRRHLPTLPDKPVDDQMNLNFLLETDP